MPKTAVKAGLAISPFNYECVEALGQAADGRALLRAHLGASFTLTASGRQALGLVLDRIGLASDDEVAIMTTSGGSYVSACVTSTIEQRCRWAIGISGSSKAVIVIHEWGRPCEALAEAMASGLPVIEDCAYAFAARHPDGRQAGRDGHYAIYSLPKLFSVSFGGLAVSRMGGTLPSPLDVKEQDYLCRAIAPELSRLPDLLAKRAKVWRHLAGMFSELGARPFFEPRATDTPAVFMFRHDAETVPLSEVRERFEAHGVEASVFYGENAFYVPAHHRMSEACCAWLAAIYAKLLADHGALA
ncbi:DegT/DnrJ/EryC1/StrS family aminotransferase [Sphingomonas sp.]|uniref:DegT/DnrJ/EryC1/StrS family aminotransferase n=1 Tax=Sphingomonas sp. TaxID=28214 RepID=UPI0025FAD6AE|nr:DegT/DnrJ/EryC1/StrS family aminotransferase [Sphingomonas sp.]MBV9528995.1 DegT/DnrJ/EryC1/StrS family aminotransferase [Sphingomonas sp.]